jgi:uracil-DNA glycosylase family 4
MATRLQVFRQRWAGGCGADECSGAHRVVLCRGQVPCDVLFVGEAPGESEDTTGVPFVGPAGRVLDTVIEKALRGVRARGCQPRLAFTNLVGCIPLEQREDGTRGKASEPLPEQVKQCGLRLREFVRLCDPKVIVCVGAQARDWLDPKRAGSIRLDFSGRMLDVVHPAGILRAPEAKRGLLVQQSVVRIANAVERMYDAEGRS